MAELISSSTTNSANISFEDLGPPGIKTYLRVVPKFDNDPRTSQEVFNDQNVRKFRVTARFANNNAVQSNINLSFPQDSGDSLFAVSENVAQLRIDTPDGSFSIYPNQEKRLSTVSFECEAKSSAEASQIFNTIVGPALDHLSYKSNTPLHIVQISSFDEKNHITTTEILSPHPIIPFSFDSGKVNKLLAPVYAMYREAINSTSPFYKFFCLYKILEGLLKTLNPKLYSQAKEQKIDLPPLKARVPSYRDMQPELKAYEGKSISRFFDEFLTNRYRNSMAHFISDAGAVLNVNEVEEMKRYSLVINISDLCCRELITHFEQCLDILEKHAKQ